jgi:hypothetical protein
MRRLLQVCDPAWRTRPCSHFRAPARTGVCSGRQRQNLVLVREASPAPGYCYAGAECRWAVRLHSAYCCHACRGARLEKGRLLSVGDAACQRQASTQACAAQAAGYRKAARFRRMSTRFKTCWIGERRYTVIVAQARQSTARGIGPHERRRAARVSQPAPGQRPARRGTITCGRSCSRGATFTCGHSCSRGACA